MQLKLVFSYGITTVSQLASEFQVIQNFQLGSRFLRQCLKARALSRGQLLLKKDHQDYAIALVSVYRTHTTLQKNSVLLQPFLTKIQPRPESLLSVPSDIKCVFSTSVQHSKPVKIALPITQCTWKLRSARVRFSSPPRLPPEACVIPT